MFYYLLLKDLDTQQKIREKELASPKNTKINKILDNESQGHYVHKLNRQIEQI